MKKINKTPFAAAMGVAVISTFATTIAQAEANPFGMSELSQGYMQVAEADAAKPADAKAAEAKCGGMMDGDKMKKGMEGACGDMMKGKEGACGMMHSDDHAKEGADMKMPEGKCGDQCGDNMKKCEDAKAKEGACGAMMKGCGEGMQGCGDMMKSKEGTCGAGMKMPEHKDAAGVLNKAVGVKVIPAK